MNMNMNIAGAAATIAVASIVANSSADRLPGGGSVTDGTAEGAKMGEDDSGITTVTPATSAAAAAAAVATVVANPAHQLPPTAELVTERALGAPQRNNLSCELERSLAFVPAGKSVFLRDATKMLHFGPQRITFFGRGFFVLQANTGNVGESEEKMESPSFFGL